MVREAAMETYLVSNNDTFPNNDRLKVVLYRKAILSNGHGIAAEMEKTFLENNWGNAWRNGVYDYHHYHHYHTTAHEVLGVYQGEATLQLGGPEGVHIEVSEGDVIILPVGIAHKKIKSSHDFRVIGAYPNGQNYDMNYGKPGERPEADKRIQNLPLPSLDPVYGKDGKLITIWSGVGH